MKYYLLNEWNNVKFNLFFIDEIVSELSFQEGSVYNSEMECTNFEQQSQADVKLEHVHDGNSESHFSIPPMNMNAGNQLQVCKSIKFV